MYGAIITFFGEQNVWKDFELEYLYIVKQLYMVQEMELP